MCWIPSHIGINMNEKADALAKEAISNNNILNLKMMNSEAFNKIKSKINSVWIEEWQNNNSLLKRINPNIKNYKNNYRLLNRRDQVVLARLRLNTSFFNVQHHFTQNQRMFCTQCNDVITSQHMLIDCPISERFKRPIKELCHKKNINYELQNILSDAINPSMIIAFFKNMNFYKYI